MKKKEENKKEKVKKSTVTAKTYAIFFLILVIEAVVILSSIRETTSSSCVLDDKEYFISVEKSKGIPWIISILNKEGIRYNTCGNDSCEDVYNSELNKTCFKRSDIHKSLDCAKKYLCNK
ncbi:MAG: hypothetical protein J6X02_01190 [Bacilli bacterium]|nr:hypothetical protein [Bacilli bacterium]